ncbi:MAG: M56 family metallopeptidase [Telluria sp.]
MTPWRLAAALTVALAVVLVLRPLAQRACGPRFAYAMWLLPLLALLAVVVPRPAWPAPALAAATPGGWASAALPLPATLPMRQDAAWWHLPWVAGMLLAFAWFALQQWLFVRRLGALTRQPDGEVFVAPRPDVGPAVYGVLRPRIVVPSDFFERYSADEQSLILAHERTHIRRGDPLANAACCLLQIVFWFHPLVHYAGRCFRYDQELACDAAVLASQPGARRAYASTILKTQLAAHAAPLSCSWQFRHPLKGRIMTLQRRLPQRYARYFVQSVLAALGAAACVGVWAAQGAPAAKVPVAHTAPAAPAAAAPAPAPSPVHAAPPVKTAAAATPAAAPAAEPAPDEPFNVVARYTLSNGVERVIRLDGLVREGGISSAGNGSDGCDDSWDVRQRTGTTVEVQGRVSCNGKTVAAPRLIIQIGKTGALEVQGSGDKPTFRVEFEVTRA